MVSSTAQTERRRALRQRGSGQKLKKRRAKHGTPSFPIQPEGYDPSAPDGKKSSQAAGG